MQLLISLCIRYFRFCLSKFNSINFIFLTFRVLTNNLLSQLNVCGRGQKRGIEKSAIYKLIQGKIKFNTFNKLETGIRIRYIYLIQNLGFSILLKFFYTIILWLIRHYFDFLDIIIRKHGASESEVKGMVMRLLKAAPDRPGGSGRK